MCRNCGTIYRDAGKSYIQNTISSVSTIKPVKILPELEPFKYPDDIKIDVGDFYTTLCAGKVKRNGPRRALIYWSIITICKRNGITFDSNEIQNNLNIKQSEINKAVKALRDTGIDMNPQITFDDILQTEMDRFDIRSDKFEELKDIYTRCKRICPEFNSCKLETLASGTVYYYLKTNLEEFDDANYFLLSEVSDSAILKIYESISSIYNIN
jgi:hypothetical protein